MAPFHIPSRAHTPPPPPQNRNRNDPSPAFWAVASSAAKALRAIYISASKLINLQNKRFKHFWQRTLRGDIAWFGGPLMLLRFCSLPANRPWDDEFQNIIATQTIQIHFVHHHYNHWLIATGGRWPPFLHSGHIHSVKRQHLYTLKRSSDKHQKGKRAKCKVTYLIILSLWVFVMRRCAGQKVL